jgi:hypothetical protein
METSKEKVSLLFAGTSELSGKVFSARLDFSPRLISSSLQGVWIIGHPFYSDISLICTTTFYPSLIP